MRLLHSADWQLGLKAGQVGDRASAVREQRFETAERVVELARERSVDLVLLAGDTFDGLDVDERVVRRAVDILAGLDPVPVVILPGNHDPYVAGSVWQRRSWLRHGEHVILPTEARVLEVLPGVALFPCPLKQKRSRRDPTDWIPAREPGDDRVRIGLAHGALLSLGVAENFPIAQDRADRGGLDYLALGDWHGLRIEGSTAYSGTIEQTAFDEREPGHVLIVDLDAAGAAPEERRAPRIETVRVGRLDWLQLEARLGAMADVEGLEERIAACGDASSLLLRLRLDVDGAAPPELHEALTDLLRRLEAQLYFLTAEVTRNEGEVLDLPAGLLADVDRSLERLLAGETLAEALLPEGGFRLEAGPTERTETVALAEPGGPELELDEATIARARRLLHELVREESA